MKHIIIGEPLEKEVIQNKYKLFVTVMEGDADYYHDYEKFYSPSQIDELKAYISLLDEVDILDLNDDEDEKFDQIRDDFGSDQYGITRSFDGYTLTYFDEHGVEKKVIVLDND